jgi:hypothetical protein
MSALGQKLTWRRKFAMSAFTPESGHGPIAVECALCAKSRHRSARRRPRLRDCAGRRRNIRGVVGDLDFVVLVQTKTRAKRV